VQYISTTSNFTLFFVFQYEQGLRIHGLFTNIDLLGLITTIVHMPFYSNFAQEMISMKLGLKNNKEIIV
jgi:hypothetical protein